MSSLIALIVAVAIIVLVLRACRNLASQAKAPSKSDLLPYSKQKYFFSAAERSFYEVLRRLTPDYTIFAKVRLADLVHVAKGAQQRQAHFNRISRKHIDFVLCNGALAPVLAIELDDSSHERAERMDRDRFVDEVLAAVQLPVLHVPANRVYVIDEVREMLRTRVGELSAVALETV